MMELLNQARKNEESSYGEAVRLSNELRAKQAYDITDLFGNIRTIPAKSGFDCETALYGEFTAWLGDNSIKKSESLFWFVIRVMSVRFPDKHNNIRFNLVVDNQHEFDLIKAQSKNNVDWFGEVGYFNKVRLDGSLDKSPTFKEIR